MLAVVMGKRRGLSLICFTSPVVCLTIITIIMIPTLATTTTTRDNNNNNNNSIFLCGCTGVVTCPHNSNTMVMGALSIDECVCDPGFAVVDHVNKTCLLIFDCPANSHPTTTTATTTDQHAFSAQDCTCDSGYVDANETCLEIFDCPANSHPPIDQHAFSANDCTCDAGYTRFENRTCELLLTVVVVDGSSSSSNSNSSSSTGLSVATIAGIAAAGGVSLVSAVAWGVFKFALTTTTPLASTTAATTTTAMLPVSAPGLKAKPAAAAPGGIILCVADPASIRMHSTEARFIIVEQRV